LAQEQVPQRVPAQVLQQLLVWVPVRVRQVSPTGQESVPVLLGPEQQQAVVLGQVLGLRLGQVQGQVQVPRRQLALVPSNQT